MPLDKSGKFHLNAQKAHASDKMAKAPKEPALPHPPEAPKEGGMDDDPFGEKSPNTTLHDHGDGSFHTEGHDGERVDHPTMGHALAHMAKKHEHDAANLEDLKHNFGQFFDEEMHEGHSAEHDMATGKVKDVY